MPVSINYWEAPLRQLTRCPNCKGSRTRPWGETVAPNRLHQSQDLCKGCGLVFSNPVCEWNELEDFYKQDFWEEHWPGALSRDPSAVEAAIARQRSEVALIRDHVKKGKLFEVGSGTGGFLAAAREQGFEVSGIETSPGAVKHAREVYGLDKVICGSLPQDAPGGELFDVVFSWHVIEHVVDLDEFVSSLYALLKPGGLLWIGTENYRNASEYLDRARRRIRGKSAPFATASEHTMVFTPDSLSSALTRRGFSVSMAQAYQPAWAEKRKAMRFRTPFSLLYFLGQHAANALANTGSLMRVAARKIPVMERQAETASTSTTRST